MNHFLAAALMFEPSLHQKLVQNIDAGKYDWQNMR